MDNAENSTLEWGEFELCITCCAAKDELDTLVSQQHAEIEMNEWLMLTVGRKDARNVLILLSGWCFLFMKISCTLQ